METQHCQKKPEEPNAETIAAMREARDIAVGRIKSKAYYSVEELMKELNGED